MKTRDEIIQETGEILNALTISEKVDMSLPSVSGLQDHAKEMDEIATKALETYKDLCDMGLNVADAHAGKVYEVAAQMLKTALDARDAKVSKKLKMIELQIKKLRVDKYADESGNAGHTGVEFDRNEILKLFQQQTQPPEEETGQNKANKDK